MKTKYFFLAAIGALTLASCSNDEFVGDTSPTLGANGGDGSIQFAYTMPNATRADIGGKAAADLLGGNFYVMGTKGNGESTEVEPATTPTTNLVFDNYLVHYTENTAGKTESNTANWEYVGIVPGTTADCTNKVRLSTNELQTIKYWDYSQDSYDFFAFSTGDNAAIISTTPSANNIGVTKMKYGTNITSGATAYTLYVPTVDDLAETYITDIKKVEKANYGKEVVLKFKNVGAKVRMALYETVPGYSVKGVKFYREDGTSSDLSSATKYDAAYLIGSEVADQYSFPSKGQIDVAFAKVGANNKNEQDYDIATATLSNLAGTETYKTFDNLNYTGRETTYEVDNNIYLGRTLPNATFAGSANASYYKTVFPVSTSYPLTLRVDYTLVSTDGSAEEIHVYGAKAVVPSTYTKWLPNYAYTYIFKISDNTNGWTSTDAVKAGLFPITFDAVVTEATDATGEQTTITTVAAPTITTYQQGHNSKTDGSFKTSIPDEYKIGSKKLYVQVMDNNFSPAKLVGDGTTSKLPKLNAAKDASAPKYHASLLYKVGGVANATEAMVMDALQNRNATVGDYNSNITGRNNVTLEYNSNIANNVTSIVNGVDNNSIAVTEGEAAEINIANLTAGTYAYVYDYSWQSKTSDAWTTSTDYSNKTEVVIYESITPGATVGPKAKYYSITTTALNGITPSTDAVTVDATHLYFSKTKNGSGTTTYSYISVVDKIGTTLPKGVVVVAKADANITEVNGTDSPVDGTFYFDKYYQNNGSYAVKVIKVVSGS